MSAAPQMPMQGSIVTSGNFLDENVAKAELDRRLKYFGDCFNSIIETPGELVQLRPGLKRADPNEAPKMYIDRMLQLKQRIRAAGWKDGTFGVECKRSGYPVGLVVSQCIDYGRSLFRVDGGTLVHLKWIFIWPLNEVYGDIASVMAQQRIGCVRPYGKNGLAFRAGSADTIVLHDDLSILVHPPACGNKVGSR